VNATSSRPPVPVAQSLSARRRLLDEAAAQLVAAWDTDLSARAPEADGSRPQAVPSANARQAHPAVVSAAPPPSPSANIPTQGVELPTDIGHLIGNAAGRKPWPWVVAAAAILTPLLLWGISGDSDEPASMIAASADPQAATAAAAEEAAADAPREDALPAASPQPQHTLVVRTIPPGATLRIDGVAVDNPYSARHASDTTLHLVATANDHKSAERDLTLDEDVNLMITLSPSSTAGRSPAAAQDNKARPKRAKSTVRKRRAQRQKPRPAKTRARRRAPKKSATGFVSSNPYR